MSFYVILTNSTGRTAYRIDNVGSIGVAISEACRRLRATYGHDVAINEISAWVEED